LLINLINIDVESHLFPYPYPPNTVKKVIFLRSQFSGSLPISNLVDAKDATYAGIIKKVGASPFFCHYWTQEQKLLYKLVSKTNDSFMTIDVTGSIAKKIQYKHVKSKYVFLYQCMYVSSAGSVPVFQMLSADHTAIAITTWLLTILSNDVAIPKIVK